MQGILWLIFSFVLIIFSVMSLVLVYHWREYGTNNRMITMIQTLYLGVGVSLIIISAVTIGFA